MRVDWDTFKEMSRKDVKCVCGHSICEHMLGTGRCLTVHYQGCGCKEFKLTKVIGEMKI